jgi:hypothetical protein
MQSFILVLENFHIVGWNIVAWGFVIIMTVALELLRFCDIHPQYMKLHLRK